LVSSSRYVLCIIDYTRTDNIGFIGAQSRLNKKLGFRNCHPIVPLGLGHQWTTHGFGWRNGSHLEHLLAFDVDD
jgi:hypothetical protein